jgi:hypothetical protein
MVLVWFFKCLTVLLQGAITLLQPRDVNSIVTVEPGCHCLAETGGHGMYSKLMQSLLAATIVAGAGLIAPSLPARADQKADIRAAYIESFGDDSNSTFLDALSRVFMELDTDGNGITAENIDFFSRVQTAELRSNYVSQWLRFDLDGDLKVSRKEVEDGTTRRFGRRQGALTESQRQRVAKEMEQQIDKIFAADADHNGLIEGAELYQPQDQRERNYRGRLGAVPFALALLKADPDGDGKVTQAEASQIAAQSLDGIDAEIIKRAEQREGNRALGMSPECPSVDVSKDSQLVMFGAYEGSSLSAVTVAGQDDVTYGATVFIEDGAQPMTVFLSSYSPMIWEFKGATQRVSKVVAFGGNAQGERDAKPAVGVIGLEKTKLQFVKAYACFQYFHDAGSKDGLKAKAVVERMTGRAPDLVLGQYGVTVAPLPGGEGLSQQDEQQPEVLKTLIAKSGATFFTVGATGKLVALDQDADHSATERDLLSYNPHGLMSFNVSDVVSEAKVEPYNVYPEHAGLMQLEAQGKIARTGSDAGVWKVNGAIHFPPGLAGALSTSFFLPKGTPMPGGNPGHSCVYVEQADGKIAPDGAACR